jgi:hypothetical protein
MNVIYIAGPYRSKTQEGIDANIKRAEEAAIKFLQAGWAVVCPHKNTGHLDGAIDDIQFIAVGMELLSRCDAIYMLKGSENSMGAKMELALAKEMGLDVYYEET